MITLDDLLARTRPALGATHAPTARLDVDEDVAGVFAWFAEDEPPDAIRLVVRGQPVGVLQQEDILDFFAVADKSNVGASSGFLVPGNVSVRAYRFVVLRCPVEGCPVSPVRTPRFDPANPPTCDVHPGRTLERDA
jgi:hypothetical protein